MPYVCHFTGRKSSFGKQRTWRGQAVKRGGFGLKPTGITRRKFRRLAFAPFAASRTQLLRLEEWAVSPANAHNSLAYVNATYVTGHTAGGAVCRPSQNTNMPHGLFNPCSGASGLASASGTPNHQQRLLFMQSSQTPLVG